MKILLKLATIILMISLLLNKSSFAEPISEEIEEALSVASVDFIIDYELLKAISYASSYIKPNFVQIADTKMDMLTRDAALELVNTEGWLLGLKNGNISQYIVIKELTDTENYMSKFGESRNYTITKIVKKDSRIGLMGLKVLNREPEDIINTNKNIYFGAKKFKEMIKKYGLRNAINIYCECSDNNSFVKKVSEHYFENTGKKMEDLFIN